MANHPEKLFQHQALYNARANREMFAVLSQLTEKARMRDAGSWFGSLHGILNHLIITDINWLRRFRALSPNSPVLSNPVLDPPNLSWSHDLHDGFSSLSENRMCIDDCIIAWFDEFPASRSGEIFEYQDSAGSLRNAAAGAAFAFLFTHQTHHRGQISQILDRHGLPNNFADNLAFIDGWMM